MYWCVYVKASPRTAGDSVNSVGPGGKHTLDGKEYDFVFEIEIEEGKKAKLGMNKDSNAYMVASQFIDDHDLNPDYLETIVGWLDEQVPRRLCLDLTPGLNRNTDSESKPEPRTKPEMGRRSALRPRTCICPHVHAFMSMRIDGAREPQGRWAREGPAGFRPIQ